MHYCGFGAHLTRRRVVLLWIVPVLTLIAALTNAVHGLNWPSYRMLEHLLGGYMYYEHGPSFWLLTAYSYLLNIASSILLLRQSTRIFRIYQTQSIVLFASVLIPWIGNILYNSRIITVVDLTPAAYIITGSLLLWNMLQFKLFDIVPIARDTLFEQLREIAIVLDAQQRIIDMNPAALKHFGITAPPSGSPAADVLHRWS
jgi:PAS domain-containing protein